MFRHFWLLAAAVAFSLSANLVEAATKRHLLTESDPGGLDNVFLREYADLAALTSGTQSLVRNLAGNVTPTSSINGLTWAGDRFMMIVEADPGGIGVNLLEFWATTSVVPGSVSAA